MGVDWLHTISSVLKLILRSARNAMEFSVSKKPFRHAESIFQNFKML